MRKPKYYQDIKGLRKQLSKQYKRPETINRKVSEYKERNKTFTVQKNELIRTEQKIKNLFSRTKEKIKGKDTEEIQKIWRDYQNQKSSLKSSVTKSISQPFKQSSTYETKNTQQDTYLLNKNKLGESQIKIFNKIQLEDKQPKWVLIILEGINTKTGKPVIISDSMSFTDYRQSIEQGENVFDELESITDSMESGQNFKLNNYRIKFIYK